MCCSTLWRRRKILWRTGTRWRWRTGRWWTRRRRRHTRRRHVGRTVRCRKSGRHGEVRGSDWFYRKGWWKDGRLWKVCLINMRIGFGRDGNGKRDERILGATTARLRLLLLRLRTRLRETGYGTGTRRGADVHVANLVCVNLHVLDKFSAPRPRLVSRSNQNSSKWSTKYEPSLKSLK